ncbi:tyrosine-type recombinase/integrase [Candidatus Woesearchaeota archaeon]|nr:tyrosine-type recombinase/integrase [Candidatus Woesearchaeota archaeon]
MRKLPKIFNREDIAKLVDAIDEPWLMTAILFGLFCGLRLGEVCNLRVQDIDFTARRVCVDDSKNPRRTYEGYGKDRVVPFPDCFSSSLKRYLELIGEQTYLFPSIRNSNTPIATGHLWRAYKQALLRANLCRVAKTDARGRPRHQYNFHTLRHTYATLIWEKTGDILSVKAALGHSKIETTMIYTHVTSKVIQDKVNAAFGQNVPQKLSDSAKLDPLGILMRRLALGEIDGETFRRLKQEIRQGNNANVYIG